MSHLEILGTGSYLPEEIVPNSFFSGRELNIYDGCGRVVKSKIISEGDILKVTGIMERRRAREDEWPSDMGYDASVRALEDSGISADSLVGIIVATVTEKTNFPSAACKIQKMLGARDCFAYDINNACAGFSEALIDANAKVLRRPGNYLVVGSESLSKITDYSELNSTLFDDGAGACVLAPTEELRGILAEYSKSNPFDGKDKWIFRDSNDFLKMPQGKSVMRRAIKEMLESTKALKEDVGWDRADVYIPHQANIRIIQGVERRIPSESDVYKTIEKYGNMSSATCAVALDEARRDGTIKKEGKVIITAFGAGLVTSAVAVQF